MKHTRKIAAAIMAAAMTLQAVPLAGMEQTAHAEGGWSKYAEGVTELGTFTYAIHEPQVAYNWAPDSAWTGSYVYYGQYLNRPVKYRVLDPNASSFGGTTMLLDCDTTLFTDKFRDNSEASNARFWAKSDLYKVLNTNNDSFLKTSFTSAEAAAIAESTRAEHALEAGTGFGYVSSVTKKLFGNYVPLTGEKIFLLDAEDVSNSCYGYSNTEAYAVNRRKKKFTNPNSRDYGWWLRSSVRFYYGTVGRVGIVKDEDNGINWDYVSDDEIGVSPALNVDLSSVMFVSQVNDETGTYGKEFKLTVKDSSTTLTPGTVTRSGNTVTVPYTVTDSNRNDGITADTVSVLITSSNGFLKYYAPLTGRFSANGTGTFDLPADYAVSDDVYVIAEDVNGQYLTDYASEMVDITVPELESQEDDEWSKYADGVTTLGTSAISGPKAPEQDSDAWTGSYVYYGEYKNRPVKYRVLDPKTSVFGGRTMLLDCDTVLFKDAFRDDRRASDANVWAESDLYKVLNTNNNAFLKTSFTGAEAAAIAESTRKTHTLVEGAEAGNVAYWTRNRFGKYTPLTGEKIFLLDAEDVSNTAYGYSVSNDVADNRIKKRFKDPDGNAFGWWLRSPFKGNDNYNVVGIVYGTAYHGCYSYLSSSEVNKVDLGVSPAFNVDLSSVMLASQVNDETGTYGREYKLTVKDRNTTITLGKFTCSGNTVTVPYTVTDSDAADGITADTVSVLITGADGAVKYYAPLTGDFSASGSGTFDLPADYTDTDTINIFAEDVNGHYLTDYASEMVAFTLTWSKFNPANTTLGVEIGAPKAPEQNSDPWTGSYVYYGQYENRPVKYRVLDPNTSLFGGTTMLLDCDTTLFNNMFRDDWQADDANVWAASDLYKVLNTNDDAFLKTSFTGAEAAAIAESTRAAHALVEGTGAGKVTNWAKGVFVNYTPLTGEKIFLLDVEDVSNTAYGYSVTDETTKNRKKEIFTDPDRTVLGWWLRSPSCNYCYEVGSVFGSVYCIFDISVDYDFTDVSPAFNVDLSSVMFASQVNDETGTYGREYKLTVKDSNTTITTGTLTRSGNTVVVPYTVTDSDAEDGITADTVTVLITGADGAVKYYAPLTGDFSANGSGTFDLRANYAVTDKVYILAEDTHEGDTDKYLTDYASEMVEISISDAVIVPVQQAKPTLTYNEGKMTIAWAEDADALGYHVQYCKNNSFTGSSLKELYLTKSKTSAEITTGIKAGEKWYVRVRSYIKDPDGGRHGIWSSAANIKLTDLISTVTLSKSTFPYTGNAVKVGSYITVKYGDTKLKYGDDFTLSYSENVECGVSTAQVTVKGTGKYSGTITEYYTIVPAQQAKPTLTYKDGKLNVEWIQDSNAEGYQVMYSKDSSFSSYNLLAYTTETTCELPEPALGENWYVRVCSYIKGSDGKEYGIWSEPSELKLVDPITSVSLSKSTFPYTGKAVKVGSYITVKSGDTKLKFGKDFTMTYSENIECGVSNASVTVQGIGYYTGTITKKYTIVPAQQAKPTLTVKNGKLNVEWCQDSNAEGYQVQYSKDSSFSSYKLLAYATKTTCELPEPALGEKWYVRVRSYIKGSDGKKYGIWSDSSELTLVDQITSVSLSKSTFPYTGIAVKVGSYITVKSGDTKLKFGTDFTMTYSTNVECGVNTAKVTVTGTGKYSGTITKKYTIVPAQQAAPKLSTVSGKLHVEWTADQNAQGYQVQYCQNKDFTGDTLHSSSFAATATNGDLKYGTSGSLWYVRVRAYITSSSGTKYGEWSAISSLTVCMIDNVTLSQNEFTYTGNPIKVGSYITVKSGDTKLKYGTDFTLSYKNNTAKGIATVTVTGIGEYSGTLSKTYTIK